jgi:hypothetical protein
VDETMHLLAFRPAGGGPLTLVVNFALHCDTVGGTLISADYPGHLTRRLQEALDTDTVVLFLTGAAGDINHIDVLHGEAPATHDHELFMKTTRPAELTGEIGRKLAEAVLGLLPGLAFSAEWDVAEAHTRLRAGVRQPTAEQLARARALLATQSADDLTEADDIYDYDALLLSELGQTEVELELQAVRLGPAALVGIPNEVFTELGQLLRAQAPLAETLVVELANGAEGYLPTARAFAEGGYETRLARSSKLVPETGDAVVLAATELLERLDG